MPVYKWSETADSNATADPTINWAEGQSPSSVNDSARAMMAAVAKWKDDTCGGVTLGGTSTVYTLTTQSVFDSLALMNGSMIAFYPNVTNGAAPTLNVDGLGGKPLRAVTGVNLRGGELIANSVYAATYKFSTAEWLLHDVKGGELSSQDVSSAATISWGDTAAKGRIDSTYNFYEIQFRNLVPVTNTVSLLLEVSQDTGGTWKTSGYSYGASVTTSAGATSAFGAASQIAIVLSAATASSTAANSMSGRIRFTMPSSTTVYKNIAFDIEHYDGTTFNRYVGAGAYLSDTLAIDAMRLRFSSGNVATCSAILKAWN